MDKFKFTTYKVCCCYFRHTPGGLHQVDPGEVEGGGVEGGIGAHGVGLVDISRASFENNRFRSGFQFPIGSPAFT